MSIYPQRDSMKCERCGRYSSTRICWECSMNTVKTGEAFKENTVATPAQTSETPLTDAAALMHRLTTTVNVEGLGRISIDELITLLRSRRTIVSDAFSPERLGDDPICQAAAEALTASQSSLAAERREREEAEKRIKLEEGRTGFWREAFNTAQDNATQFRERAESAESRIAELEDRINGGWVDAALPAKD